jgi:phasin protein
MSADFPNMLREVFKLNIEYSRRAFESFMATSEQVWGAPPAGSPLAYGLQPLGDKILKSFRDNAAAHFAFVLKFAASKDANDALRLYAEHINERIQTLSQQFQDINRLALQITTVKKLADTSVAPKIAADKQNSTPTVPSVPPADKATAQSLRSGANGGLTSQVASALQSNQRRVDHRDEKVKKARSIQKAATPKAKAPNKKPKSRSKA